MLQFNLKHWRETLTKNEDKIILTIGFFLVAILSFGAGKLSETYHPQAPIIFQDAPGKGCAVNISPENVAVTASADNNSNEKIQGKIIGNKNSKIYHVPGGAFYNKISPQNRMYFNSEDEAQKSGYRKAKN